MTSFFLSWLYIKYSTIAKPKGSIRNIYKVRVHLIEKAAMIPELMIPIRFSKRATLSPMDFYMLSVWVLKLFAHS